MSAWIDFNDDGDWDDPGEKVFDDQYLSPGFNTLYINVPSGATITDQTFARFRFSSVGGLSYTGLAPDGEVEDHQLGMSNVDFGDAPDGPFSTLFANNGAFHIIDPFVFLGDTVDSEMDGMPDSDALGDDLDGSDDEDGVVFYPMQIGQPSQVDVIAHHGGYLYAWIDFNGNGNWSDPGEKIFENLNLTPGLNALHFTVSQTAMPESVYARFRLNRDSTPVQLSTGEGLFGEVEDYLIMIETVVDDGHNIPDKFSLFQNTPNPFNPSTFISFQLPRTEHVRLLIYNTTGQVIRVLVDELTLPGQYTVQWDGRDEIGRVMPAGIYIYRIETESFTSTRKLIFMK